MLSRRKPLGFTLVELLVGMALMAALMLIAVPNFSTWLQNTQIRTASEAVLNGVHLARAEAVRRNVPVIFQMTSTLDNTCTVSTSGKNWVVSLDPVAGLCGTPPSADLSASAAGRIVQVRSSTDGSKNATVEASQASITFNGLGRPTAGAGMNVTVRNPTGGSCNPGGPMRCMRVTVSSMGQVRLCDPQAASAASGNPQGC